jgi:hypothetical protein
MGWSGLSAAMTNNARTHEPTTTDGGRNLVMRLYRTMLDARVPTAGHRDPALSRQSRTLTSPEGRLRRAHEPAVRWAESDRAGSASRRIKVSPDERVAD